MNKIQDIFITRLNTTSDITKNNLKLYLYNFLQQFTSYITENKKYEKNIIYKALFLFG